MVLVGFMLLTACSEAQNEDTSTSQKPTEQELIDKNRELLKQERARISKFIEANGFNMEQTGSGMYYMFLKDTAYIGELKLREGDQIEYRYRITLLDGTPIANSIDDGTRTIAINKDQSVIALHEAFQLMTVGDKLLLIAPSHLAYGISKNDDGVPPHASVIYELEPIEKLN